MSKLIILRGNSGSGKTTVAKELQNKFGRNTMLISQDVIRRDMLKVRDNENSEAIPLMKELLKYGYLHSEVVILEGIMNSDWYKSLFELAVSLFQDKVFAYYFDLPFEETLKRHQTKPNRNEFGENEMRQWWKEKDFSDVLNEFVITEEQSLEIILSEIYETVTSYKYFETERLIVRQYQLDDIDDLLQVMSDNKVHTYTKDKGKPWDKKRTEEYITFMMKKDFKTLDCFHGAVIEKQTNQLIGLCGLNPYKTDEPDIEWKIGVPYWGKGYATELGKQMIESAFTTTNIKGIYGMAQPENLASRKVMEKIGMKYLGDEMFRENKDSFYYIKKNDEMEQKKSIEKTKEGFEESFKTGTFYNKQTKDETHLQLILNHLKITEGMKVLDLGTGMGYLAFPIAQQFSESKVVGLDIVEQALEQNRKRAAEEEIDNIKFVSYDGMKFPFHDESFDLVITRYALHHFPAIKDTFQEISRVLKPKGAFFLIDPAPNENDTDGFVDAYMQMKKDGHIKFYTKREWQELGKPVNLNLMDGFETEIRFPKKKSTALDFEQIMGRFDKKVIEGYQLEIIDDEIWITERVNNLIFQKQ